jgi:hypothetical protein
LKINCRPIWSPFLDQGWNGKGAKIRKLSEDKIGRNFVGGRNWRTTFLSAQLAWFFFPFICNFLFGFHVSLTWMESCRPRFYCLILKGAAVASWSQLWKERKEAHHPLTWKEITADHRIRIKYSGFLFFAHPRLQPRINIIFNS